MLLDQDKFFNHLTHRNVQKCTSSSLSPELHYIAGSGNKTYTKGGHLHHCYLIFISKTHCIKSINMEAFLMAKKSYTGTFDLYFQSIQCRPELSEQHRRVLYAAKTHMCISSDSSKCECFCHCYSSS